MGGNVHCRGKRAGKMEDAETGDLGQIRPGHCLSKMVLDIGKNTYQLASSKRPCDLVSPKLKALSGLVPGCGVLIMV